MRQDSPSSNLSLLSHRIGHELERRDAIVPGGSYKRGKGGDAIKQVGRGSWGEEGGGGVEFVDGHWREIGRVEGAEEGRGGGRWEESVVGKAEVGGEGGQECCEIELVGVLEGGTERVGR